MLLVISYFSVCVYLVFISTTLRDVINYELKIDWSVRIYILLTTCVVAFITQVRELKYLVPFSLLANSSIIVVFIITLYYIFKEPLALSNRKLWPELSNLPSFFGYTLAQTSLKILITTKISFTGQQSTPSRESA